MGDLRCMRATVCERPDDAPGTGVSAIVDRGDLNAAMLDAGRVAPGCISDAPAVERALCGKESCRRASLPGASKAAALNPWWGALGACTPLLPKDGGTGTSGSGVAAGSDRTPACARAIASRVVAMTWFDSEKKVSARAIEFLALSNTEESLRCLISVAEWVIVEVVLRLLPAPLPPSPAPPSPPTHAAMLGVKGTIARLANGGGVAVLRGATTVAPQGGVADAVRGRGVAGGATGNGGATAAVAPSGGRGEAADWG